MHLNFSGHQLKTDCYTPGSRSMNLTVTTNQTLNPDTQENTEKETQTPTEGSRQCMREELGRKKGPESHKDDLGTTAAVTRTHPSTIILNAKDRSLPPEDTGWLHRQQNQRCVHYAACHGLRADPKSNRLQVTGRKRKLREGGNQERQGTAVSVRENGLPNKDTTGDKGRLCSTPRGRCQRMTTIL